MSLANLEDVATILGRPITTAEEIGQVNHWLAMTGQLIAKRLGPLAGLDAQALRSVSAEVVARRVKNPDGIKDERIDDYYYRLDPDAARVGLYLTEQEWELLTPGRPRPASFTVRPTATSFYAGGLGVGL